MHRGEWQDNGAHHNMLALVWREEIPSSIVAGSARLQDNYRQVILPTTVKVWLIVTLSKQSTATAVFIGWLGLLWGHS
jgi:hypothetical protein